MVAEHIGTKSTVQIRSHAQKFFAKCERETSSSPHQKPSWVAGVVDEAASIGCTAVTGKHVGTYPRVTDTLFPDLPSILLHTVITSSMRDDIPEVACVVCSYLQTHSTYLRRVQSANRTTHIQRNLATCRQYIAMFRSHVSRASGCPPLS